MLDPGRFAHPQISVAVDPAFRTERDLEALRHRRAARRDRPPGVWRRRGAAIAAVAAALAAAPAADAAPGDLDPAFAGSGLYVHDLASDAEQHRAVALAPGGRIVAAGDADGRRVVAAYRASGAPDPAFGTDGVARAKAPELGAARGVAVDGDGRIVTVGPAVGLQDDAVGIARLRPDGEPDAAFAGTGHIVIDADGDETLHDVAIDADGGIVAVGEREARNGDAQVLVVRLTAEGEPQPGFGVRGQVVLPFEDAAGYAVALLGDGHIQVAGRMGEHAMLARLDGEGNVDEDFGRGGFGRYAPAGKDAASRFADVAVLADGHVLVTGWATAGRRGTQLVVMRVRPSGKQDEDFGDGGVVLRDPTEREDRGNAIAVAPDGRILVGGWRDGDDDAGATWVLRLTDRGAADGTFGTGGELVADVLGGADVAAAVAVQPDGHVVFAGAAADRGGAAQALVGRVLGDLAATEPAPVPDPAPEPVPDPAPAPVPDPAPAPLPVPLPMQEPAPLPPAPSAGPPAAGAPTGAGAADRTPPVLRRLRLSVVARSAARARTGGRAQLRFTVNEAGTVVARLQRRTARGRHVPVGAPRRASIRPGANRVALSRPRALRPGRYRVAVTAADRAGNRAVRYVAFRVRPVR